MSSPYIPIRHIMSRNIIHVPSTMPIYKVATLMRKNGIGSVLVSEGSSFVGILTETDIVHKAVAKGLSAQITKADSIMSYPIIEMEGDRGIIEAADCMMENGIRHLVVTDQGQASGILSLRDLIQSLRNASGDRDSSS